MTIENNYAIAIAMLDDWLKTLAPNFQPMRGKTNRTLCARLSRAFSKLQVVSMNFDWFIALPAPVMIGRNYYFGIGVTTVI